MENTYAEALYTLAQHGEDDAKIVDRLVEHLKKNGRMKLLPGILRELKRIEARKRSLAPRIEIASDAERHDAIEAARVHGIESSRVSVNPSLIRGWRARSGGTLADASAKRNLIDLYRRITSPGTY